MTNRLQSSGAAKEEFARRLCARLNDGVDAIEDARLEKLAFARKLALRAQRPPQARLTAALARPSFGLAGTALAFSGGPAGRSRTGASLAAIALVLVCLLGIFQFEQQRRVEELADIDSALLTNSDDVPISAYADHGFNAYLKQNP